MSRESQLGRAIRPEVSEARLARQWARIGPRIRVPRSKAWFPVAAAAAMAVVVVGAMSTIGFGTEAGSVWDGAVVATGAEPTVVTLKDGSRIDLAGQTRLEVARRETNDVVVRILEGRALFDVTSDPERAFSVMVENVTVQVIGTRFAVRIVPEPTRKVEVSVERGSVACSAGGERVVLQTGQTWSSPLSVAVEDRQSAVPEGAREPGPSASAAVASAPVDEPVAAPDARRGALGAHAPSAREIFENANTARLSGDFASAAAGYRTLLAEHPGDSRVGLAAFELGRLLQDRFGDPSGAAGAFRRAIGTGTAAAIREDAMARLVRAYATMGADGECNRARTAYLESFPQGVHATAVARACGDAP